MGCFRIIAICHLWTRRSPIPTCLRWPVSGASPPPIANTLGRAGKFRLVTGGFDGFRERGLDLLALEQFLFFCNHLAADMGDRNAPAVLAHGIHARSGPKGTLIPKRCSIG